MAIISCPECGKQVSDRAVSCPECGFPINAASAPTPAPAAPAVDPAQAQAEEINKLLVLARRARESSDSKNAHRYYEQILLKDPGNWEAMFYCVYYDAMECTIGNIASAAHSVANCIYSTFSAIAELESDTEKDDAISTVIPSAIALANMLASSAKDHYFKFSTTDNAYSECSNRVVASGNIYEEIESSLKSIFPDKKQTCANFQKLFVNFMENNGSWYKDSYRIAKTGRLKNEIGDVYPEYREKLALDAQKDALRKKINALDAQIDSLPITRTAKGGCLAPFLFFVGIIVILVCLVLSVDDSGMTEYIPYGVVCIVAAFIVGAQKTPSQAVIDENIKKRAILSAERDEIQKELNSL